MKLEYMPQDSMFPFMGLDTYNPSTLLDPRYSPRLSNINFDLGEPSVRPPFVLKGQSLYVAPWEAGTLPGLGDLVSHEGFVWESELSTNAYEPSADDWVADYYAEMDAWDSETEYSIDDLVSYGDAGWKSLQDDNTGNTPTGGAWWKAEAGYAHGDLVYHGEHVYKSTEANNITEPPDASWTAVWERIRGSVDRIIGIVEFDGEMIAVADKAVFQWSGSEWTSVDFPEGIEWSGGNVFDYVITSISDVNYLIFTNGVDTPLKGYLDVGTLTLTEYTIPETITTFYTIEVFAGRVFIGGLGSAYREYIYWAVAGKPENWTGTGSGLGSFNGIRKNIKKLIELNARLLVFSDDSIGVVSYVGGDVLFSFEILNHGVGLLSGRSIINVGPYLFFASQENIYLYDGTRTLRPVGDAIKREYRDVVGKENLEDAFAFHDPVKHRIYWNIPSFGTTYKMFVLEYDIYDPNRTKWFLFEFGDKPCCANYFVREDTITFASFGTTKFTEIDPTLRASDTVSEREFPIMALGLEHSVVLLDRLVIKSDDEEVEGVFETKDFVVPDAYKSLLARWVEVELEYKGRKFSLDYSIDEGYTWADLTDVGGDSSITKWTREKLYPSISSRNIRFRIKGDCFFLRWFRVWFTLGGYR